MQRADVSIGQAVIEHDGSVTQDAIREAISIAGYDVADYRDIDPVFGTLAEAEALIGEAHEFGMRIIVDIVPNHCSDAHPWFCEAVAAGPGSAARDLFWFRDGRGEAGELPPNNWQSIFGGPAWTRLADGQWYLHLFDSKQPDVDWRHPDVHAEWERVLRFWLDRGVDGLRIDAAPAMGKATGLPDADYGDVAEFRTLEWTDNPHWDVDTVHEVFRRWRRIADTYAKQTKALDDVVDHLTAQINEAQLTVVLPGYLAEAHAESLIRIGLRGRVSRGPRALGRAA